MGRSQTATTEAVRQNFVIELEELPQTSITNLALNHGMTRRSVGLVFSRLDLDFVMHALGFFMELEFPDDIANGCQVVILIECEEGFLIIEMWSGILLIWNV
ncbi:hypothetical protein FQA39_LY09646 [Lamprigera yunnana]|nr:hypothetical protein FQA39_LY09646 [Lamprigera yunnana]